MNDQQGGLSAEAKRQRAREDAERFQLGVQAAVRRGSWQMARAMIWFSVALVVGAVLVLALVSTLH